MNTEIIVIVDRSGSMAAIDNEAASGFNSFITDQSGVPGAARVTTVFFNTHYELRQEAVPLNGVAQLRTVAPEGMTALLDALGRTIKEQGVRIAQQRWADKVIVCVITDGEENSSQHYGIARIHQMVSQQREAGWAFIFMGANIDAIAAARSYGMDESMAANFAYTGAGARQAFGATSVITRQLRGTTF